MRHECLYEGNGKLVRDGYVPPIYTNDEMMIGCTYQYLEDVTYANATYLKGKQKNPNYTYEEALREELKAHIEMIVENTWEEFGLCKERLAENLASQYEED